MPRRRSDGGQNGQSRRSSPASGEAIAFTLLAGVGVGLAAGYGVDRLVGTLPAFTLVGVFAGFAVALYAVFLETK